MTESAKQPFVGLSGREEAWRQMTWTIMVCPKCGAQRGHRGDCLDDPPGLRPLSVHHRVVSAAWRDDLEAS